MLRSCSCSFLASIYTEKTEGFDFFKALTLNVDILENILNYLQYSDLQNCSKLNEIWANRVEAVLRKRLAPTIFSLPSLHCDDNKLSTKPALCIVLLSNNDFDNFAHTPFKLNTYLRTPACKHRGIEMKKKPVIEIVENDVLAFTKCPIIALNCRTITTTFELSVRVHGIIFPNIPNVNISIFRLRRHHVGKFEKLVTQHIGDDHNLDCLLAFGVNSREKLLELFVEHLKESRPTESFALGGGFVLGKQAFNYVSRRTAVDVLYKKDEILCASFSTPKNMNVAFNAYSLIIPNGSNAQKDIESCLLELKNNYTPRKYGIIFQITCVSRDIREIPLTTKSLLKLFPNINILGFTGDGEIGWNYFPGKDTNSEPKEKRTKEEVNLFHSLTTVIVLLTWGKRQQI